MCRRSSERPCSRSQAPIGAGCACWCPGKLLETCPLLRIGRKKYLESKVLKEVRGSVGLVSLCPAAGIDPHANSRGLGPWGVLSGDLRPVSDLAKRLSILDFRTVKPLERVVDWVVDGRVTGEEKPRLTGWMDFRAARLRRAWLKLNARRREAIVTRIKVYVEGRGGME